MYIYTFYNIPTQSFMTSKGSFRVYRENPLLTCVRACVCARSNRNPKRQRILTRFFEYGSHLIVRVTWVVSFFKMATNMATRFKMANYKK